jgi:hypothetical protein
MGSPSHVGKKKPLCHVSSIESAIFPYLPVFHYLDLENDKALQAYMLNLDYTSDCIPEVRGKSPHDESLRSPAVSCLQQRKN